MNAYLLGHLLGRLFVSYLLVWTVMLVLAQLDWRAAFARTHRWYGLLGVVLGLAAGLGRGGLS